MDAKNIIQEKIEIITGEVDFILEKYHERSTELESSSSISPRMVLGFLAGSPMDDISL